MLNKEHWELKHKNSEGKYNQVTDFARFCYYNFMKKKGKLLDLCSGKGADAIFFHNKGFKVTALDYSPEAIKQFNATQKRYDIFIASLVKDISETLPFEENAFDYCYIRLGLHYFTDDELRMIIPEMLRVIKPGGLLFCQVKSTSDKDFGHGKMLEKDMYEDETGYIRHFFSKDYADDVLEGFHIILNEERKIPSGSAYLEIVAEKK
ncbi:MAG: class I SAM-dependent methyltransferase [Nanoarchaeota archaeon]|nr:class I SAM-dependent methyltransferase [Nanoarchaeota archaeon]